MRKLFVVVLLFVCIGCAENEIVKPTIPITKSTGITPKPVVLSPQQLGEIPPVLSLGTKIVFRQGNIINKQWTTLAWVIKDTVTWQGKQGYLIDTSGGQGQSYMIWDTNLNIMASLDGSGKVITAFNPCIKLFSFPMKVGNGYSYGYDYWADGKKVSLSEQVKVEGRELVSVPAGKFDVFVVKRSTVMITEKYYYSPQLGFPVKWEWSQAFEHPQGPGEFIVELVKFDK